MTTPYLDEAERCSKVAMMNNGRILISDTPANLKKQMAGEVVEIVCSDIRSTFSLLKNNPLVKEVQAFGDRVNVVVGSAVNDVNAILGQMKQKGIIIVDWRVIKPSLENVFISLLTEQTVSNR